MDGTTTVKHFKAFKEGSKALYKYAPFISISTRHLQRVFVQWAGERNVYFQGLTTHQRALETTKALM